MSVLLIVLFVKDMPKTVSADKAPLRLSLSPFDLNFRIYLGIVVLFTLGNASDAFLLLRARDSGIAVALLPLLWVALHVVKMSSSLPAGVLSDRLGRKRLILGGWLIYAAVYLGFALWTTPLVAWALFLIYGLYFGLTEGVEKAFVADLIPPELRGTAFGLFHFMIGISALPASLLMGELWTHFNASTAFFTSGGLAFTAAVLLSMFVKEKNLKTYETADEHR
jgi:MFS family permease